MFLAKVSKSNYEVDRSAHIVIYISVNKSVYYFYSDEMTVSVLHLIIKDIKNNLIFTSLYF